MNTHSSQLEENMVWLQHNAPYLYRKAAAWQADNTEAAAWDTALGWNVQISDAQGEAFFLHSLFDREREYQQVTANVEPMHSTVVLFGCAGGDFLKWLTQNHPQIKHLIIVEPSVKVFRLFMEEWSLPDILGMFPKASLVIGEKQGEVGAWLKEVVSSGLVEDRMAVIIELVNYRWHYNEYTKEIHKALVEILRFIKVNQNTLAAFRDLWLVNVWHNLQYGNADIADFRDCFRGIPAIIVSAGPSLDKNIHLLQQAKDRALIVAVGSAISVLHRAGIQPHFRVAIDPSPLNEKIFAGTYEDGVPLIYSGHLYYNILKNYHGPAIHALIDSNSGIETDLVKKADLPLYFVEGGFSVANIAVSLLAKWKCGPIVFVGQDLAYTENRLHASGAWDNEFEEQHMRKMHVYKDIFGNDVYSDAAFDGIRQLFEKTIVRNPDVKFLNATEGGIPIKGAENLKLIDLLSVWAECEDLEGKIREVVSGLEKNGIIEKRRGKLCDAVRALKKGMGEFSVQVKKSKRKVEGLLQKNVLTDKEARAVVRQIREFEQHEIYQVVHPSFAAAFAMRREGYLKNNEERILPQVRLFYLEMNDILEYLEKMLQLICWYEQGEEFKILIQ